MGGRWMSRKKRRKGKNKKKMKGMDFIGAFKPNGFTPRLKTATGTEFFVPLGAVSLPAKLWGDKNAAATATSQLFASKLRGLGLVLGLVVCFFSG